MDWLNFSLTLPVTDPTWIFLLVLLIILFAPILLNKLRIPHIIGRILINHFDYDKKPVYEFVVSPFCSNDYQCRKTDYLYIHYNLIQNTV